MPASAAIAQRFSAAAPTYDRLADIQRATAARVAELAARYCPTPMPPHILDAGCGTGMLTRAVHTRYPKAALAAMDIAPGMLAIARRQLRNRQIAFIKTDFKNLKSQDRFGLIVSSAALHWAQPLDATFTALARNLAPGGWMIFALMVAGTLRELHAARRRIAPGKKPAATLPSPSMVRKALRAAGMRAEYETIEERTVNSPSAEYLLRALHGQGVTGGSLSHGRILLTRRELAALTRDYDRRYRDNHGVYATYRIFIGAARKPFDAFS